MKYFQLIIFLGALSLTPRWLFAETIGIAVLQAERQSDDEQEPIDILFKQELEELFEGEFELDYTIYKVKSNDSAKQINALLDAAYRNRKVQYVLVLDLAANQVLGYRAVFKKPTFLPIVFNAQLLGYPRKNGGTGIRNFHYITQSVDFEKELSTFQSVAQFKHVVLVADPKMKKNVVRAMKTGIATQAKKAGVSLRIQAFVGQPQEFVDGLPENTDAVLYGSFPSASDSDINALINAVNEKGLPSFSLSGERYVRMGAFVTNNPDTDWKRLARHTAIHLQEVVLGAAIQDLPIYFESANRLIINMATSRKIKIAPSFDIISNADLINADDALSGTTYSLTDVATKAVAQNLSLVVQKLRSKQAQERVKEVRGALLPQINFSVGYQARRETENTRNGVVAEDSTDGSISLSQPLFREELWAAYTIEKYSALSEKELVREIELDIIQAATAAYLDVLRDQTSLKQNRYNLGITRENYRLATTRVAVGDSDKSDLYRWESELAVAKQSVLQAKAQLERSKQLLNRILNRPIKESVITTVETLENPTLLVSDDRITGLIRNRYSLDALTDFFVDLGVRRSPELKQIQAQLKANNRQLLSDERAYWVPDLDMNAEVSHVLSEERTGGVSAEGNDWIVGLELSLPLFEGGARAARMSQSALEIKEAQANLTNTRNTIEQEIRSQAETVHASYQSIELAKASEKAAQQNYDLVASSYAQGQVAIIVLLDAQEALIEARETSMNAVYTFLIDLMDMQRAIGAFDFFLTNTERLEFSEELMTYIKRNRKATRVRNP